MKKFLMTLALMTTFNVSAGMIEVDVSDTSVAAGEAITVDIIATDFEPIDTFNFRLDLDTSIFSYEPASLVSDLHFSNFFGILEVNAFDGYIAFSFLDFDPILTPDFTLASFTLNTLAGGASDFSFSNAEFYQGGVTPVNVVSTSAASVSVTEVPEPATWLLIPFMLMLLARKGLIKS